MPARTAAVMFCLVMLCAPGAQAQQLPMPPTGAQPGPPPAPPFGMPISYEQAVKAAEAAMAKAKAIGVPTPSPWSSPRATLSISAR